jgi:hypothetical protein
MSLKNIFFNIWSGLKRVFMHLRILPDPTRNFFFKKDTFYRLEWLKTCFDEFANTSRPPETFFQKKIFFTVWSGLRRVLMHLRILPNHQKLFFKKDIFERLEWIKTYFDAFSHTSRPPESCP